MTDVGEDSNPGQDNRGQMCHFAGFGYTGFKNREIMDRINLPDRKRHANL